MAVRTVCLDASVIIAVLQEEAGRVQDSIAVMAAIERGELQAVCPTLIVMEVRQPPVWDSGPFSLVDYLRKARVHVRALDVVVAHRLKMLDPSDTRGKLFRDQVYVATAIAAGATHLYTWDDKHAKRVRDNAEAHGITLCHPVPPSSQVSLW